jgi:diadenosine tetraphosphate (Ap4A) HIT family hydrolase
VKPCHICADNAAQDDGTEPWAIARLSTGYVRLNPNQYFPGACFFLTKSCVHELHDLTRAMRDAHLAEMAEVASAIFEVFAPRKLNYEALGNGAPHLHWWLTPRYATDPRPIGPIWEDLEFLRAQWTSGCRPDDAERDLRRSRLLTALASRPVTIEQAFR